MSTWYRSGGKTFIDTITTDNAALRKATTEKDTTALRDACTQILVDATHAKSYAPVPDNQAQAHWAKSLPLIIQGAVDCADAIDVTADGNALAGAVGEMNIGFTEFNLAITRLKALLG